jgi:hypothetical protein
MLGGCCRYRGAFHPRGPSGLPLGLPSRCAVAGWPADAAAARLHRCRKTPARPLLAPLSRDESRPRAPLRLLQVDISTSTTTDHPNISIRGIRGRDGCLGSTGSRLPSEISRRGPSGSGVGTTDARRSPPRLLAPETLPQPRSPRAPRVARRRPPPVWSDAVGCVALPSAGALARSARRQGGVAPRLREEARC